LITWKIFSLTPRWMFHRERKCSGSLGMRSLKQNFTSLSFLLQYRICNNTFRPRTIRHLVNSLVIMSPLNPNWKEIGWTIQSASISTRSKYLECEKTLTSSRTIWRFLKSRTKSYNRRSLIRVSQVTWWWVARSRSSLRDLRRITFASETKWSGFKRSANRSHHTWVSARRPFNNRTE
jgi:hypothetical protein